MREALGLDSLRTIPAHSKAKNLFNERACNPTKQRTHTYAHEISAMEI